MANSGNGTGEQLPMYGIHIPEDLEKGGKDLFVGKIRSVKQLKKPCNFCLLRFDGCNKPTSTKGK